MAKHTEIKVGIFFLVGLIILGIITFKVKDLGSLLKKRVTMTTHFGHACGLKEGDTVAIAGLKVGEINDIRLSDKGVQVVMGMEEDATARITSSSRATVAWAGLIGNRYVDISLGKPGEAPLPPGSDIESELPIDMGEVLGKIDTAATGLQDMFKSFKGVDFGGLVDNLNVITKDMRDGKGSIGKLMKSEDLYNKITGIMDKFNNPDSTVGKLLQTSELHDKAMDIAKKLEDTVARAQKILTDNEDSISSIVKEMKDAVPDVKAAFAAVKDIAEDYKKGKGILPALVKDEKMLADLRSSLANLDESLESMKKLAKDAEQGKGLLGQLIRDEELKKKFTAAIASISEIAERVQKGDNTVAKLTNDKGALYDDLKKTFDEARETLRRVKEQIPVGTFAGVLLSGF